MAGMPSVTPLTIGGRTFNLLFRNSYLIQCETFMEEKSWARALANMSAKSLAAFLLAGMMNEDRNAKIAEIHQLMDKAQMEGMATTDLWNVVTQGLENSGVLPKPGPAPDPTSAPSRGHTND